MDQRAEVMTLLSSALLTTSKDYHMDQRAEAEKAAVGEARAEAAGKDSDSCEPCVRVRIGLRTPRYHASAARIHTQRPHDSVHSTQAE